MEPVASDGAQPSYGAADTIGFVIDQRLIRECVGPALASCLPGLNVRLFGWPDDLVELGDWCSIALVVLWISNPAIDFETAFEATLEAAAAKRPIAILSNSADSRLVARALTLGVRGYLSTSTSLIELASAIRFVAAGGTYIPPSVLNGLTEVRPAVPENNSEDQKLSPRQVEVLERLQEGKPNKIIAYELGMAEATVKVHVRMIMRKLKARNRTEVALRTKRLRSAPGSNASETLSLPRLRVA
jgi:DNA-binding NarL/FixJ family response regulator